jgi:hypothetical protein
MGLSFSWLFTSDSQKSLVITAESEGVRGFPVGKPLSFFATAGDTVGDVVGRLNKYRGPHHQIMALRYGRGGSVPFSEPIRGELQVIV